MADLYAYQVSLFVFKLKNNFITLGEQCVVFNNKSYYNLRNEGSIQQIYCRTEIRKRFIMFSSVHIWNKLPECIKDSVSLSVFKKSLLQYYISTYDSL